MENMRLTVPGTREAISNTTISKVCLKLAKYEDSGLTPEEVIRLKSVATYARLLYEICADLPIAFPSAYRFVWTMGELKDALEAVKA